MVWMRKTIFQISNCTSNPQQGERSSTQNDRKILQDTPGEGNAAETTGSQNDTHDEIQNLAITSPTTGKTSNQGMQSENDIDQELIN